MNSSKYFDEEVLSCPHCGWQPEDGIASELLIVLDKLQCEVEETLEIESCARCNDFNDEMGGYKNGYHVQGIAADIHIPESMTAEEFADLAEECGAEGIGINEDKGILHIDMRGHNIRWEE